MRTVVVEQRVEVRGSDRDVYGLIAEPANRPAWLHEVRGVEADPGWVSDGDTFTGRARAFGHEVVGRSLIVRADAPRSVAEHLVVGVSITSAWVLEPRGSGTLVAHRFEAEVPGGLLGPLEALALRWFLRRVGKRSLEQLAALAATRAG